MTEPTSGSGAARPAVRRAVPVPIIVAVLLGALVGAAVTYYVTSARGVPAVVQGTVSAVAEDPHGNVSAIALRFDDHEYVQPGEGESLAVVAEVFWTDAAGQNHMDGRPACLARDAYGQRIELGVVDLHGKGFWPAQVVAWVHCLS